MSIIAIDPGTTNTGLVYMDERRIIAAKTLHFNKPVKDDQYQLMARAAQIAGMVADWAYDKPYEAIVIEGFMTYFGRQSSYTFQTPYLCGFLHSFFMGTGMTPIVIQTSRQVLNARTRGNVAVYKDDIANGKNVWGDCSALCNDHLRSAAAHGIYYYIHKED